MKPWWAQETYFKNITNSFWPQTFEQLCKYKSYINKSYIIHGGFSYKYEKVSNLDIKGMWKVAKINENKGKY